MWRLDSRHARCGGWEQRLGGGRFEVMMWVTRESRSRVESGWSRWCSSSIIVSWLVLAVQATSCPRCRVTLHSLLHDYVAALWPFVAGTASNSNRPPDLHGARSTADVQGTAQVATWQGMLLSSSSSASTPATTERDDIVGYWRWRQHTGPGVVLLPRVWRGSGQCSTTLWGRRGWGGMQSVNTSKERETPASVTASLWNEMYNVLSEKSLKEDWGTEENNLSVIFGHCRCSFFMIENVP